jgi:NodT family efflux transporter outer membrane factor (OMF) lipoprotein
MKRISALMVALLAGCAVGPNFKRPAPPTATGYGTASPQPETDAHAQGPNAQGPGPNAQGPGPNAQGPGPNAQAAGSNAQGPGSDAQGPGPAAQRLVVGQDIPAQWWTVFQSPKLNQLIDQALHSNTDMKAAQAALRQAHELYLAQRTTYWPTVQGSFDATRSKFAPSTLSSPITNNDTTYGLYTAQLSMTYVPDIFGGTRRAVEAARAQEESTRFQLEATYLTLSSNVVVMAIQEASLRAQIAATERLLEVQQQLTQRVKGQQSLGAASNLDLLTQQAAEAQTAATLAPLQKQLAQTRDALTALLGKLPSDEPQETFRLEDLVLPPEVPVSLPSKLVEHRPDVRQAEANLHVASAEAGVALADMFPQFAITGDLGSQSLKLNDLFKTGTGFWDVGASLTQTLFDAGALLHKHRAADAALDQAGAQYQSAVIVACQNVADTLHALQIDAQALKASAAAERAAKAAFDLARQQQDLGSISFVAVLNAESTWQQAETAFIQAQANRYSDTAALFQALGGGWWNRTDGKTL